jgi:hypothetical protein
MDSVLRTRCPKTLLNETSSVEAENGICAPWHGLPDGSISKIAEMRRRGLNVCRAGSALWLRWKREGCDLAPQDHPDHRHGGVRFSRCQLCLLVQVG